MKSRKEEQTANHMAVCSSFLLFVCHNRTSLIKILPACQPPHEINTKILDNRTLIAKPIFILIKDASRGVLSLNMPK
jgi:hypothetical protein